MNLYGYLIKERLSTLIIGSVLCLYACQPLPSDVEQAQVVIIHDLSEDGDVVVAFEATNGATSQLGTIQTDTTSAPLSVDLNRGRFSFTVSGGASQPFIFSEELTLEQRTYVIVLSGTRVMPKVITVNTTRASLRSNEHAVQLLNLSREESAFNCFYQDNQLISFNQDSPLLVPTDDSFIISSSMQRGESFGCSRESGAPITGLTEIFDFPNGEHSLIHIGQPTRTPRLELIPLR